MLSPHELATLMLVRNAPDQLDLARTELETLRDRQLISLEPSAGEARRPTLTAAGVSLLDAAARLARRLYRETCPRADEHFAY
ncbi:hypothetical protein [Burkholderia plantarii]|uniref:Uncharacterized protein n=1 Tax=Burkholderia plantarii TaxID=41899 RepID=A0A0B6RT36_BURPL|nr:hypothetical protein [Burkholderia plantarii]AJK48492.1 hypothetical protein BGL_2c04010 [Burkholderia plantarii]ALK32710.1 hypothetical protein bpln_2g04460 [Burkholderia plantarii]WLE61788.1 hypothetical protein GIY62_30600 [Burkholderia plantarii]GLZ22997.1 hypothetical protein Bpla01_65260 [Burkholderia plantarii]